MQTDLLMYQKKLTKYYKIQAQEISLQLNILDKSQSDSSSL